MKAVVIMSGVSGSGKSHYINRSALYRDEKYVSANDYFISAEGIYQFNAKELDIAHALCFRNFLDYLNMGIKTIYVDNCNTTVEEIAPYMLGARAYGYFVELITLMCRNDSDLQVCYDRNVHKVPAFVINNQHGRLLRRNLQQWNNNPNFKHTVKPIIAE